LKSLGCLHLGHLSLASDETTTAGSATVGTKRLTLTSPIGWPQSRHLNTASPPPGPAAWPWGLAPRPETSGVSAGQGPPVAFGSLVDLQFFRLRHAHPLRAAGPAEKTVLRVTVVARQPERPRVRRTARTLPHAWPPSNGGCSAGAGGGGCKASGLRASLTREST
jgi:hypothetical protein